MVDLAAAEGGSLQEEGRQMVLLQAEEAQGFLGPAPTASPSSSWSRARTLPLIATALLAGTAAAAALLFAAGGSSAAPAAAVGAVGQGVIGEAQVVGHEIRHPDGYCLHAAKHHDGVPVHLWSCNEDSPERWHYVQSSGHIRLISDSSLCLDAESPYLSGSPVRLAHCSVNALSQGWKYYGSGQLRTHHGGLCLSTEALRTNGTAVRISRCNRHAKQQQWRIPKVSGATGAAPPSPRAETCLCLFDVDRTLTGKQGFDHQCPGNQVFPGVSDWAYGGGDLTLSLLGRFLSSTFCGGCHLGVVTAGDAGGRDEKHILNGQLKGAGHLPKHWCTPDNINCRFVKTCEDSLKATCAKGIVDWYHSQDVHIKPSNVHFFDDHTGNTNGFADHGYNARQVSCESRDWDIGGGLVGLCGALPSEVVPTKGVHNC
eukprot:CAMPEP_0115204292 /NCGR_PEP_ID=MMETSP0270-20121206/19089_1 /TAXON_ID=71861 /ORGANISM="Scrippsiella trochoidea, Strain CCMP3099" /LENGTH=427 /DNA_ID=CAMNT_0002617777 /DNA_START=12 /DNA_END=1295 /DNA_ORIENTATION=+